MSCTTTYTRGYHYSALECINPFNLSGKGESHLIAEVDRRIAPLLWQPHTSEIWVEVNAEVPDGVADKIEPNAWHEMISEILESMDSVPEYWERYIIDYQTGVTEEIEGTLDEAKEAADNAATYTQRDIVIKDESGEEVTRRPWWGVIYDPDETEETEDEVIQFGTYGYFGAWQ